MVLAIPSHTIPFLQFYIPAGPPNAAMAIAREVGIPKIACKAWQVPTAMLRGDLLPIPPFIYRATALPRPTTMSVPPHPR